MFLEKARGNRNSKRRWASASIIQVARTAEVFDAGFNERDSPNEERSRETHGTGEPCFSAARASFVEERREQRTTYACLEMRVSIATQMLLLRVEPFGPGVPRRTSQLAFPRFETMAACRTPRADIRSE